MDKLTKTINVKDVIDENLEIDNLFVREMVNGVLDKKDELYKKADQNLKDWKMSRLGLTDQAILCLGLVSTAASAKEILFDDLGYFWNVIDKKCDKS